MTERALRCGRIVYTNDLPIYGAFDAEAIAYPGILHEDVPARLNALLLADELDLGPMSAFAYAHDAERFVLLPDLCIGAREQIVSVILVSQTPPALLRGATIATSNESSSGRNLLRILLERRYGVKATFGEEDDPLSKARAGQSAMIIGDAAVDALLALPKEHVYDLGTIWRAWTGEQSVMAVWVARREVFEQRPQDVRGCMHALTDSYSWWRGHREVVIAQAQARKPRPAGFYEDYYAKLNFTFHSAAQSGLAAYCRELLAIGAIDRMPPIVPEAIGVSL